MIDLEKLPQACYHKTKQCFFKIKYRKVVGFSATTNNTKRQTVLEDALVMQHRKRSTKAKNELLSSA